MTKTAQNTIAVIDGNYLMHRSYHAIKASMVSPGGTPTNAVYGFLNTLLYFYSEYKPARTFCAFDAGKSKARTELLPEYKAQRKPMDEALRVQFPLIENLLCALNIPVLKVPGWEGDDILGSLAARNEAAGGKTLILTGDKDMNQLVTESTHVIKPKHGAHGFDHLDVQAVFDKYGIWPRQFRDLLGIMGDSSDNYKGVQGVGEVGAVKLLAQFDSLSGIYDHIDEVRGATRTKLETCKDQAFVCCKIATIITDLDVDCNLDAETFPAFNTEAVRGAFGEYKLVKQLPKYLELCERDIEAGAGVCAGGAGAGAGGAKAAAGACGEGAGAENAEVTLEKVDLLPGAIECFFNLERAQKLVNDALSAGAPIGVSVCEREAENLFDTSEPVYVFAVQGCEEGTRTSAAGCGDTGSRTSVACIEGSAGKETLARVLTSRCAVCENLHVLLRHVCPANNTEKALIGGSDLANVRALDLGLLAYDLNSNGAPYTPEKLAEFFAGAAMPAASDVKINVGADTNASDTLSDDVRRAIAEAVVLLALKSPAENKLAAFEAECAAQSKVAPLATSCEEAPREESANSACATAPRKNSATHNPHPTSVYRHIDAPLTPTLVQMERTGMRINTQTLHRLSTQTALDIEDLRTQVLSLAGEDFNLDSPKQLSHILFDVLGLPPKKKTATGYSTDATVLRQLQEEGAEIAGLVLKYRELTKIKNTYLDALPRLIASDDRIHTTFHATTTATGRLSSSDPNLQNIPVRTPLGKQIRACFVPLDAGHVFLGADYSQIELRVLAHLSEDVGLIGAFNHGADFHAATAAATFGVPVADVTPEQRRRAKAVNFGIVYGQQAFGLAQSLDIPMGEAKEIIDRYFATYPRVREYLDEIVTRAEKLGYAETMFGRRRYIPELAAKNKARRAFGARTAMNHPMQGSAADIIKLAMVGVQKRILHEGLHAKLMVQVHDELDFSVPAEEAPALEELVRDVMQNVVDLRVPLIVDVTCGPTWAQAH